MRLTPFFLTLACGVLPMAGAYAQATTLTAELMPLAHRSLLLDAADGANRAIVVGERGHVLVSESRSLGADGSGWRQVDGVPTRATLTAVASRGSNVVAVGHDGTILHSADEGLSWTLVREERMVDPDDDPAIGAPLLDVAFVTDLQLLASGAYGRLLESTDGGRTWLERALQQAPSSAGAESGGESEQLETESDNSTEELSMEDLMAATEEVEIEEEGGTHINAIAVASDGVIALVGESGTAYVSTDGGRSFESRPLDYEGSMFGVLALGPSHFLTFGLRGNVFETRDAGLSWERVDTGSDLSLMGGAVLAGGDVLLVGGNGVLVRRGANGTISVSAHESGSTLAGLLPAASGPIFFGELGLLNP